MDDDIKSTLKDLVEDIVSDWDTSSLFFYITWRTAAFETLLKMIEKKEVDLTISRLKEIITHQAPFVPRKSDRMTNQIDEYKQRIQEKEAKKERCVHLFSPDLSGNICCKLCYCFKFEDEGKAANEKLWLCAKCHKLLECNNLTGNSVLFCKC